LLKSLSSSFFPGQSTMAAIAARGPASSLMDSFFSIFNKNCCINGAQDEVEELYYVQSSRHCEQDRIASQGNSRAFHGLPTTKVLEAAILQEVPGGAPADTTRLAHSLVSSFCNFHFAQVVPSEYELHELWLQSQEIPAHALVESFCDALSWKAGILDWQPRLRALHAIKYFADIEVDGWSKQIARSVSRDAAEILLHLTKDAQCNEMAQAVLELSGEGDPGTGI